MKARKNVSEMNPTLTLSGAFSRAAAPSRHREGLCRLGAAWFTAGRVESLSPGFTLQLLREGTKTSALLPKELRGVAVLLLGRVTSRSPRPNGLSLISVFRILESQIWRWKNFREAVALYVQIPLASSETSTVPDPLQVFSSMQVTRFLSHVPVDWTREVSSTCELAGVPNTPSTQAVHDKDLLRARGQWPRADSLWGRGFE